MRAFLLRTTDWWRLIKGVSSWQLGKNMLENIFIVTNYSLTFNYHQICHISCFICSISSRLVFACSHSSPQFCFYEILRWMLHILCTTELNIYQLSRIAGKSWLRCCEWPLLFCFYSFIGLSWPLSPSLCTSSSRSRWQVGRRWLKWLQCLHWLQSLLYVDIPPHWFSTRYS